MPRNSTLLALTAIALVASACASLEPDTKQRQVASVLSYLYPGTEQNPAASTGVAELKVPFRVGVAFVPDHTDARFRLPESDRLKLAGEVRSAFAAFPFIREMVVIPSSYLEPAGGFANLDRISTLLDLDVVALVSFDQVQNSGATGWSFLNWTGIGAYVINGDRYDILTAVDTAVFDIKSRRLLMRASGVSNTKGTATMVGFSERAREARTRSFDDAIQQMIGNLQTELKAFRARAPADPGIRLILPPGYDPNAMRGDQPTISFSSALHPALGFSRRYSFEPEGRAAQRSPSPG
jgi:rhombotail lipoprotein